MFKNIKDFKFLELKEVNTHGFVSVLTDTNEVLKFYTNSDDLKSKFRNLSPLQPIKLTLVIKQQNKDFKVFINDVTSDFSPTEKRSIFK